MNSPTLNKGVFIQPSISLESSLHSFLEKKSKQRGGSFPIKSFSELLEKDKSKTLVVAEPGFGKSRLLKELIKLAGNDYECGFFDLKKSDCDVIAYIEKCLSDTSKINDILDDKLVYYHSPNFKLESNPKTIICLDALDEVKHDLFYKTIKDIENFIKKFSDVKLFISCRTHHVEREKADLKRFDFDVAEIYAFSSWKTVEYLKQACLSLSNTDEKVLLSKLSERNTLSYWGNNNVLSTPRYLEIFAQFIENEDLEKALQYDRYELFDKFIIEKLRKEEAKTRENEQGYKGKILYVKQALERLALILEIQRANEISKDDFVTFMLDTNLNLDSQLLLEIFYDRTILKDNGDSVEFENTEFQEYLAAKAISRFSRSEQIVFDVAIEQKLDDIYENWFSVLSYLVEIEPELLLPIIQYAFRFKKIQNFLLIKYPNNKYFDENIDEKAEIFKLIFKYFESKKTYFPYYGELTINLANYFVGHTHKKMLLKSVEGDYNRDMYILRANVVGLLVELFAKSEYERVFNNTEINDWKKKLIEYTKLEWIDDGYVMHRYSIKALSKICQSTDELKSLKEDLLFEKNYSVDNVIIDAYKEVDPNHKDSISIFFKNIKINDSDISIFNSIDSNKGFINFFDVLCKELQDTQPRKSAIRKFHDYGNKDLDIFYKNLEKCWNNQLEQNVIRTILLISLKDLMDNGLRIGLQNTLRNKSSNVTFKILDILLSHNKSEPIDQLAQFRFSYVLGFFLEERQAEEFIDKSQDNLSTLSVNTIRFSDNPKIQDLEKIRFPKEYAQKQKAIQEHERELSKNEIQKEENNQKLIKEFREDLKNNNPTLLYNYWKHVEYYDERLEKSDIEKIKKLIHSILEKYDPVDNKLGAYEISYRIFETVINLVKIFNIDISPYRQNLIKYITFDDYRDEVIKPILELLIDLTETELNELVNTYRLNIDKDNRLSIIQLAATCRKYDIRKATDIFKTVIELDIHSHIEIIDSIRLLDSWNISYNFENLYNSYLEKYKEMGGKDPSLELKHEKKELDYERLKFKTVSEILIRRGNEKAVDELIKKILSCVQEIKSRTRGGTSIVKPDELLARHLGGELEQVQHLKFKDKMLELLTKSCKLVNENNRYYIFVRDAIWSPLERYFINLKSERHLIVGIITDIQNVLQNIENKEGRKWFEDKFQNIYAHYLKELSQPAKISDAIKKYNELRAKKYIDISTPMELYDVVKRVITRDLDYWITSEGANKVIAKFDTQDRERTIQDYIVPKLQYYLIKEGLRDSDIDVKIYKEAQTTGDDRIDLLITYGLVGSVLLELKREENKDITPSNRVKYINKIKQYMKAVYANYCILLVFKDDPNFHKTIKFEKFIKDNNEIYRNEPNIEVLGINCIAKSVVK